MMMTYMEIATYLGVVSTILTEIRKEAEEKQVDDINEKMLEATRSAQLIMYRLAVDDLAKKVSGE